MKTFYQVLILICCLLHDDMIKAQDIWWNVGPSDVSIYSLGVLDPFIFAGAPCIEGGVFRSSDQGDEWEMVNSGLPGDPTIITSIAISDSSILVAAAFRGMYITKDTARTWTHVVHNGSLQLVHSIVFAGAPWNVIVVGGGRIKNTAGIMLSEDGTNWMDINGGLPVAASVYSLLVRDSVIYAGTINGVYTLKFNSNHWEPSNSGMANSRIISIGGNDSYLFAGSDENGVYRSEDGEHWNQINTGLSIANNEFTSFAFSGTSIFVSASGDSGGVFQSTDNGDHWYANNEGFLLNTEINALIMSEPFIYAGSNDGVYRRSLSSITSNHEIKDDNFNNKTLSLYPNPSSGLITLSLNFDDSKEVDITCFTSSGQNIFNKNYKLVNGRLNADLDLSFCPNGIYFIQIHNNYKSIFRKVIINH